MNEVFVITRPGESETMIKKSRFIGNAFYIDSPDEAARCLSEIKARHYDAKHHVYAYALMNGQVKYSDNGEPQGTAGLPMLNIIQKRQIQNVIVIVTRYFGGILLGASGLLRAYSEACKLALDDACSAPLVTYNAYQIECTYSDYQLLQHYLMKQGYDVNEPVFADNVVFKSEFPDEAAQSVLKQMHEITLGRSSVSDLGTILKVKKGKTTD